jgi:hypothetical protein
LRAHPTAARAAAKLPGAALCRVPPPPRLGTVELWLDDPHAETMSAMADSAATGMSRGEGFMRFLSRFGPSRAQFYDPGSDSPVIGTVTWL